MMNEKLNDLYQKYIDETFTEAEREEFLLLLTEATQEEQAMLLMDNTWNKTETTPMHTHRADHILNQILTEHAKPSVRKISWIRYAAAILILIAAGGYLFHMTRTPQPVQTNAVASINPGTNKAILTLSNGKTINLDQAGPGEIAHQEEIVVTKTTDGKIVYTAPHHTWTTPGTDHAQNFNSISTPAGGQYQINLPDGSKVWLNAASSLKYPTVFSTRERRVELSGEAYFEIAKVYKTGKKHSIAERLPFIVKSPGQEIEVLGTHFNINSYADEGNTRTTLLEGGVKVWAVTGFEHETPKTGVILKPGQQSTLAGKIIKVAEADQEEAIAWKNGYFQFNEADLPTIMRQLARWYNVNIVFEGKTSKELFLFKVSRNLTLQEILKIFETNGINFKIEGRTLIVKS